MSNKISDFKIATTCLKMLCRNVGVNFIDIPVYFNIKEEEGEEGVFEGGLKINKPENIAHTIYKIVNIYSNNSMLINGAELFASDEDKEQFLILFANYLRAIIYDDKTSFYPMEELTLNRLYQRPLIWILMKDIICPVYNIPLQNIKVVCSVNPCLDVARYYEEGEIKKEEINYPFIYINEIENEVVKNAFLFVETLRAYGLSPIEVVKDILESELVEKLKGLLKLAFDCDCKVNEFILTLIMIFGMDLLSFNGSKKVASVGSIQKLAQQAQHPDTISQWWFLGLIEKMLEPMRGSDWSVYQSLEPYHKEFWDKVEEIRQKRKKKGKEDGVPFNTLLRLKFPQTVGYKADTSKTLQSLLSSDRVW